MTKHVFLMDVTRHRGPVQSLVETARAHAGDFDASTVHWFRLKDQAFSLSDGEESSELEAAALAEHLTTKVTALASDGFGGAHFHVFSYDGPTLREVFTRRPVNAKVETQRYSQLRFKVDVNKFQATAPTPLKHFREPIPLNEAVLLTKNVLRDGGHLSPESSLRQMRLRGLLEKKDERARKNPSIVSSKMLIAQLVEVGLRDKWLGRVASGPGTEAIWLIEESHPLIPAAIDTRNEAAKLAEAKTDAIVASLKKERLYAPKDIRDVIFESLLRVEANGKTVAKLFREASFLAQASAEAEGIMFDFWRPATDSIVNLAIKAGVLLDPSGRAIQEGFASRGTIVSKVDAAVIDRCDACLMIETVRFVPGLVPSKDAPALAHALFKKAPGRISQDDMIDRVHDVLAMLGGKLDQDNDGVLSVI